MRSTFPDKAAKAQVLVVVLWILAALGVLALTLSHTAGMELRLSRNLADREQAYFAARAGINMGISRLMLDTNSYDHPGEGWADDEESFKERSLEAKKGAPYFSVSYLKSSEEKIYGLRDEDRKININTANRELLTILFEEAECSQPAAAAQNVLCWRGEMPGADLRLDSGSTIRCKGSPFTTIEELLLMPGFNTENLERVKTEIAVFGDGTVNFNTVSPSSLRMLVRSVARIKAIPESQADTLADKMLSMRSRLGFLSSIEEIDLELTGADEINLFNSVKSSLAVGSRYFSIESTGYWGKMRRNIEAVFDRKDKAIVFWHEN